MQFTIELLPDTFAIGRCDPDAVFPDWARGEFVSITRTRDELSIVCRQEHFPCDVQAEHDRRCLRIAGQLDFSLLGVISQITELFAKAGISVFVTSTYDTDYFLVQQKDLDRSVDALKVAGHSVLHC